MSASFHLLDLTSQAIAVQRLLRGRSAQEKLDWLGARGHLNQMVTSLANARPVYRFVSIIGMDCVFFIDGDELVFIGDNTTYTVNE